jgi:hypothetical protein
MKALFIILLLGSLSLVFAQTTPQWNWATDLGYNELHEMNHFCDVAVDPEGNQYMVGTFSYTMVYNGISITSNGGEDIFILRIDSNGNFTWLKQIGGGGDDYCNDLAIDANGDLYLTGSFSYDCYFDYVHIFSDTNWTDFFVAKMNPLGFWYWVRHAGDVIQNEAYSIALDGNGYCYVTGYFTSDINIGATHLYASGYPNASYMNMQDIFVAKLDCEEGEWEWAQRAGSGLADCGFGVSADGFGNCYVTGYVNQTASPPATNYRNQLFVGKLNATGSWVWSNCMGSIYPDWGWDIATDQAGNSYVTGKFHTATTYGDFDLVSQGMFDCFVMKLNTDGSVLWAVNAGGAGMDDAVGIAVSPLQSVYICGDYHQSANFGSITKSSGGESTFFLAKLSTTGVWQWVADASGTGHIHGYGVCTTNNQGVYVSGIYDDEVNFGNYHFTSNYSGSAYSVFFAMLYDVPPPETPGIVRGVDIGFFNSSLWLSWQAVTESSNHLPFAPDYYCVYSSSTGPAGPFHLLGTSNTTSYQVPSSQLSGNMVFFYITAYLADIGKGGD